MGSVGLGRNSSAGLIPLLQRQWVEFIETVIQAHESKIDTPQAVVDAVRRPLVWIARAAVVSAVAGVGIFAALVVQLCR